MVDFQSRDTRRGIGGSDDEDDDAEDDAEETDEQDAETAAETAPERTDDEQRDADDAVGSADAPTESGGSGATEEEMTSDAEPTADGSQTAADADATDTQAPTSSAEAPRSDDPLADSQTGSDGIDRAGSTDETGATVADAGTQSVDVAVVTVGTEAESGIDETLSAALGSAGHSVVTRERLRGEYDGIQQAVDSLVGRDDVDAVVTAGGTGVSSTESTIEAVHPLFEKALPGFGEVYRSLLFEQFGTGVVAVRAAAGIADGAPVFCLPADETAVRLAIGEIIGDEVGELVAALS